MKAEIFVKLKSEVLDPQGKAVSGGLKNLGFEGVKDVRVGKYIVLSLDDKMPIEEAGKKVQDMCEKLLVNTVIEEYAFRIEG
ncbi:phosphoribosylformylglycinamidine synthase subunit PurS [Candidatus Magnetominusculus xianensis]|uniref:Phosphoribosylformylglycinamidine synthase subunit PurS n=1 Tax=Candidatus Magnetominusculus xianensis TaxID=1748249 RepID=A0ABR5SHM6_9BACT|nr:phosphoribosylformylglycinamidine synthase subunit PurS [Candidatus Magnetominusculus xianensis]KWT91672.1 phosphoribosylformylglycinamidine synthase [Candidatus Magnetominusculus xianensis]MBF0404571.1 phosphoribosylformylglycinamidine synthase subunit PurS [Nitrospirota bacterium]